MLSSLNRLSRRLTASAARDRAKRDSEGDTPGESNGDGNATASREDLAATDGTGAGKGKNAAVKREGAQDVSVTEGGVKGRKKGDGDVVGEGEGEDPGPEDVTSMKVSVDDAPLPRRKLRESTRIKTLESKNGAFQAAGEAEGSGKGGEECGDAGGNSIGDTQGVPEPIVSNARASRRKSARLEEIPGLKVSSKSEKSTATEGRPKRKNAKEESEVNPRKKAKEDPEISSFGTALGLPGIGWTKGTFYYKRHKRYSWISPTQKIEFKYRTDAATFEGLRKRFDKDEKQAWLEYTKMKNDQRKAREVLDPQRHDEEMGIDVTLLRRKNNRANFIGKGWEVISLDIPRKRTRWISPTRKMAFRYRIDAVLFESLRKKYGKDEIQAWIEYTKIKHFERKAREVEDPEQYDDDDSVNARNLRLPNSDSVKVRDLRLAHSRAPGPGWAHSSHVMITKKCGVWISPTRKMQFRNRKDAVYFEELRQKFGTDEIQAWVEYTKYKCSIGERREVIACEQYDMRADGSLFGRWRKEEHKKWLLGLAKFGKNYKPIQAFIGTRTYFQIKAYGKRYFQDGGKIPTEEELEEDSDEDSISAEAEDLRRDTGRRADAAAKRSLKAAAKEELEEDSDEDSIAAAYLRRKTVRKADAAAKKSKAAAKEVRRKSAPAAKHSFSLLDGITNKSMRQKRLSLPERTPSRVQPRRAGKELPTHSTADGDNQPAAKSSSSSKKKTKPILVRPKKGNADTPEREESEATNDVTSSESGGVKQSKAKIQEMTKRRVSARSVAKEPPVTFGSLSKDAIFLIASFSQSLQDLKSLQSVCKKTRSTLAHMDDDVYQRLFLEEFGLEVPESCDTNLNWTWKERYKTVFDLKRGFHSGRSAIISETSVGVLRWEKEESALFEDNPQIAPVDRDACKGYIGLNALNNLPKPPNAGGAWEPPLLLHGDFEGVKIYDSANGLLSGKRRAYLSLGEEHGQVTALVACKYFENPNDMDDKSPCCFLGYDSGVVATLSASLSEDESSYHFFVERQTSSAHSSKVSAMTVVSCKTNADHPQTVLVTACYGGQVFYYPGAMNPTTNFDLKPVLAFSNSHPDLCPILSMTSTTFIDNGKTSILVCTGDRDGSVRLWLAPIDLLSDTKPPSGGIFSQVKWYKSKGKHCVTQTKFINHSVLVSGNNQGDIRMWDVEGITENGVIVPGLTLRYFLKAAHNGPVETVLNIGDVVVSSGGNDGNLIAFEATSGRRLGAVLCHYGQETFDETTGEKGTVKSCVMGAAILNKRLVSLCRDGALAEWHFEK